MNLFGRRVGMHAVALVLLSALAAASAALLGQVPYALFLAVAVCAAAEAAASYAAKRKASVSISSLITGLIIGSVSPIGAPLLPVAAAGAVAIASKHLIRIRNRNVFNPAAIGLLVGLGAFSIGDEWWAAASVPVYGPAIAVPLALILIVPAYEARRMTSALSFIAVTVAAEAAYAVFSGYGAGALGGIPAWLLVANYFFAFVMLTEPKTSPAKRAQQAAYGSGVALLYVVLSVSGMPYTYFLALLAGNAAYTVYRVWGGRTAGGKRAAGPAVS